MLNNVISKPLYVQLKQAITEDINRNIYQPGEKLPNEAELCEQYSVSRITVRKALLELVEEGYLERLQGKGTFVKRPKFKRELVSVKGYSEHMVSTGRTPHHKIISYHVKEVSKGVAEKLNIPEKSSVLELTRILYNGKRPLSYEISTYSMEQYPNLDQYIQEGISMHKILDKEYGVIPAYNEKILNVIFASSEEAEFLDCSVSDPIYEIEKTAYNGQESPIYHSLLYYHTNQVSFTISSKFKQD